MARHKVDLQLKRNKIAQTDEKGFNLIDDKNNSD